MDETTVVVTDAPGHGVGPEREILGRVGATVVDASEMSDADLATAIRGADAVLTCFRQVTAEHVMSAPDLKVVGRYGVGVDNIAVNAAAQRGIPVTNVPDYCVGEVADHALALIMSLTRGVCVYDRSVRSGSWELPVASPLRRTNSLVVGVVGFGRIGRNLSRKVAAVGFQVIVCDPRLPSDQPTVDGFVLASFDQILERADVVTLHVPLDEGTRHLIGAAEIARMKSSAVVVNVARGPLVDEAALIDALREHRIAGAGLDVVEVEPMATDHPFRTLPNVVVTPHVAYYSEESIVELQERAAENVATVLSGERSANTVNGV